MAHISAASSLAVHPHRTIRDFTKASPYDTTDQLLSIINHHDSHPNHLMSHRVTRSSAKQPGDHSIITHDIPLSRANTTTASFRKRKTYDNENTTDQGIEDPASDVPTKRLRRSGRTKAEAEDKDRDETTVQSKHHTSSKRSKGAMSSSVPPAEPSDENASSSLDASTSSRRKSAKTKKSSTGKCLNKPCPFRSSNDPRYHRRCANIQW